MVRVVARGVTWMLSSGTMSRLATHITSSSRITPSSQDAAVLFRNLVARGGIARGGAEARWSSEPSRPLIGQRRDWRGGSWLGAGQFSTMKSRPNPARSPPNLSTRRHVILSPYRVWDWDHMRMTPQPVRSQYAAGSSPWL
jgi:hypothetical protein